MCESLGIHGKLMSINQRKHFADLPTISKDRLAGDILSSTIGDLFINFNTDSPYDQWVRVAKALRIHGFKISF